MPVVVISSDIKVTIHPGKFQMTDNAFVCWNCWYKKPLQRREMLSMICSGMLLNGSVEHQTFCQPLLLYAYLATSEQGTYQSMSMKQAWKTHCDPLALWELSGSSHWQSCTGLLLMVAQSYCSKEQERVLEMHEWECVTVIYSDQKPRTSRFICFAPPAGVRLSLCISCQAANSWTGAKSYSCSSSSCPAKRQEHH